jgi:WD40 repeat protein
MSPASSRAGKTARLTPYWRIDAGEYVTDLAWSPNGEQLTVAAASGDVLTLDSESGNTTFRVGAHAFGAMTAAWSPDGALLATGGQDGHVRVWSADGAAVYAAKGGAAWVEHVNWSPDGRWLSTASGKLVRLWTRDGALARQLPAHSHTVTGLRWDPTSRELATSAYGAVRVWTLGLEEVAGPSRTFGHSNALLAMVWSPDGQVVACGCQDGSVHVWLSATGKDLEMSGYPAKVRVLAWDPASRWLATGGGSEVILWDFSGTGPARSRPALLSRHGKTVTDLAFGIQGLLASAGADGLTAFWTVRKSGGSLVGVAEESSGVSRVSWQPGGRFLASGHESGTVVLWPAPKQPSA